MKTLVLQSFRRNDVPAWLERCMHSVRDWTAQRGYEYRFLDDAFFEILPAWFLAGAGSTKTVLADYARVLWAERFLAEGYDCFIWVDADVVVFAPNALTIELPQGYRLCHEILTARAADGSGGLDIHHRINNAISAYSRGNPFLAFYRHAMEQIVREGSPLAHDALGTVLLSSLGTMMPMPVLLNVGLFGPQQLQAIVDDDASTLVPYLAATHSPLAAANLCHSLRGRHVMGVEVTDALFTATVEQCLRSGGGNLNRYRPARAG